MQNKTIYWLADKLLISEKTTQKYLCALSKFIEESDYKEKVKLCYSDRTHVYLYRENDFYLEKVKMSIINKLPEIIIFKEVIENKGFSLPNLVRKLGLSESHIRKKLQRIRKWLTHYQLSLERSTYRMIGTEIQIREFFLTFLLFTENSINISAKEERDSKLITEEVCGFFQFQANRLEKRVVEQIVRILLMRNANHYFVHLPNQSIQYTYESPGFVKFEKEIGQQVTIPREEKAYLYLILIIKFSDIFSKKKRKYFIQDHYTRKTDCYQHTIVAMKELRQQFVDHSLSYEEATLASFLSFHLYYEIFYGFSYEKTKILQNVSMQYPNFTQRIEKAIQLIRQKSSFFETIPTQALLNRYFFILTTILSPVCNEQKRYIYLLMDFPPKKEKVFVDQLKGIFRYTYNLVFILDREASSMRYADIILTTSIHFAQIESATKPILVMGPVLTGDDIRKINALLKNAGEEMAKNELIQIEGLEELEEFI